MSSEDQAAQVEANSEVESSASSEANTNTSPESNPSGPEQQPAASTEASSPAANPSGLSASEQQNQLEEQSRILEQTLSREMTCSLVENQSDINSLICPICLDVIKGPVMHSQCGNMFCENCVKALKICPLCRAELDPQTPFAPVPRMIHTMIASVLVRCNICQKEMSRELFEGKHADQCCFACPFGCGEKVTKKTLNEHCKGGHCGGYVLQCPGAVEPLQCKWHGHGGEAYFSHIADCPLARLAPFVQWSQQTIRELQSSVQELRTLVSEQQRTITEMRQQTQAISASEGQRTNTDMRQQTHPREGPPAVDHFVRETGIAAYDYQAHGPTELSFSAGTEITILKKGIPGGWLLAELKGKKGYVPASFILSV